LQQSFTKTFAVVYPRCITAELLSLGKSFTGLSVFCIVRAIAEDPWRAKIITTSGLLLASTVFSLALVFRALSHVSHRM